MTNGANVPRLFSYLTALSIVFVAACGAPTSGPANGYGLKPMYQAAKTKDGREFYFTRCADAIGCLKIASAYCPAGTPIAFLDPFEVESTVPGFFRDDDGPFAKLVCKK
ncbi:hypothetical protein BH10PSE17_BH10PSE17_16630 [soil metagenome]